MIFDFIPDQDIRKNLENAVDFILVLIEKQKDASESDTSLYMEEINRVLILYIVSIIEALLSYIYHLHPDKMTRLEYKEIKEIGKNYINSKIAGKVVAAVQVHVERQSSEITLKSLIEFLQHKKILKKETAEAIRKFNHIRNSVHLSKARKGEGCSVDLVEEAVHLLIKVRAGSRKAIVSFK
ncbi:MAG: hypothetical protein RJB39_88 [Candidatus Parcubacteria bacterium]|jgi:ribosomal protein L9